MFWHWGEPRKKNIDLQKYWSDIEKQTCIMGYIPALSSSQILVVGKFSMANYNHNISNIIYNAQFWKPGMLVGLEETNYPGWNWTVATLVTDIPFMLAFLDNFIKKEPRIVNVTIIFSLSTWSITPNARIIQPIQYYVFGKSS